MICILAHGGASSRDDPERRSKEWRPTLRREPPRREVRTPTARPDGVARAVAAAPVSHCRETLAWVRIRKPPRWSAERGPGRPGTGWSRVAGATGRKSAPVGAPSTPHRGDGIAAVATAAGAKAPVGSLGGRGSEGTCEETDKPGRSNAPRERTTLRCLTL